MAKPRFLKKENKQVPAWKESNQSGMRCDRAFFIFERFLGAPHRPMQTAAYLLHWTCIFRCWMEKKRWSYSASRVHAVTSDLGYPGRSAHYERLGRLLRDITGTPSLHFSLKLAINYIFILLLGAIKGIFVNRKILDFQITCDVFACTRPTQNPAGAQSSPQNQQQHRAQYLPREVNRESAFDLEMSYSK